MYIYMSLYDIWRHVFRETIQVANALATFGLSLVGDDSLFDVNPDFISLQVLANVTYISFPRNF